MTRHPRRFVQTQQRQRQADLVVQVALALRRRDSHGQHFRNHVLGRRLSRAAGHGDHIPAPHLPGPRSERLQGLQRIFHSQHRPRRFPIHDRRHRALSKGCFDERVPVMNRTPQREKQIPGLKRPGIDAPSCHHRIRFDWQSFVWKTQRSPPRDAAESSFRILLHTRDRRTFRAVSRSSKSIVRSFST